MPINAWSIEDVRTAEAAAMAQLPDGELMQRAARGLALVVEARLPGLAPPAPPAALSELGALSAEQTDDGYGDTDEPVGPTDTDGAPRVVVLAGSGGNGGDALYAAAFVARDTDALVAALLVTDSTHGPALAAARAAGVLVVDVSGAAGSVAGDAADDADADADDTDNDTDNDTDTDTDAAEETAPAALAEALDLLAEADVVVDGVTGIGGRPGLSGYEPAWALVQAIPDEAYVVSVDLPSGTDPSGLRPVADSVYADETVTFGVCKPVHVLAGAAACGLLTVVDIGLDEPGAPAAVRLVRDDIARLWPVPGPADDKYTRGVLGVVAGGEGYTGAPVLAVTAAVTAGVGMVRYIGPAAPTDLVRARVPEAVFGPGRVQAWLVGPGLDPAPAPDDAAGQAQLQAAREALASDLPCVVDAGGLDLLDGPRAHSGARTLLTPHAGELARLLTRLGPDAVSSAEVVAAPVDHARRAATALHATVLLKGSTTYVVPPVAALPVFAQADGPAWLGTAGSGDVLAGLAGMLLSAGLDPLLAGALAAQVHGLAGDEANPGGPVRALHVADALGAVVAAALRRGPR